MNYPQPIKKRPLNNPRLGIKSSLPNPRKLIALLYLIYVNSNKKASVNYLVDNPHDKSRATLPLDLAAEITSYLGKNEDFVDTLLSNPLVESQIEALQVALQLFFRLAKISTSTPGQSERTGGNRYPKTIDFSTNIDIIDLFLSRYPENQRNEFLISWLKEEDDLVVSPILKKLLVTFVEPTIFRITESDNNTLDFDLFGIYESFLKKGMSNIDYKGSVEAKGTSRVLGSYIKSGLHPFISQHGGLAEVDMDNLVEFKEYAKRVDTSLSIAPELDDYPFDDNSVEDSTETDTSPNYKPLQVIYFGAPGTGKSHRIKQECKNHEHYRITFHPDTDYASFVGSYKPITHSERVYTNMGDKAIALKDSVTGEAITTTKITYKYVYQAFLNAYIAAWKEQQNEEPKPVFLVIEEINRGNCAQIFGDIFQLLDRNDAGYSDYPIVTDNDLKKELETEFADLTVASAETINGLYEEGDVVGKVLDGSRLLLPNNLYIWATMNTSDQSLFPIDSAFKRRWEWKYIKIADSGKKYIISVNGNEYDWWSFVYKINDIIGSEIEQEDKKLGYFFAKTAKGADGRYIISADKFLSKVIFFLYNDVFKDFGFEYDFFKDKDGNIMLFADYFNEYGDTDENKVETFIKNLGVKLLSEATEDEDEEAAEEADIEEAEGKTGDAKLIIKFPDGRTFQGKTQFDSYLQALEAIGLDKCEPIAAKMKYHRHNAPLIAKEKSEDLLSDNTYSYVQVGDYYVVKGINTRTKRNLLNQISDELNLGIEVIRE